MDYVGFDGEQFRNFRDVEDDRPLHMLNLLKFHEMVTYPDGTAMSGWDAYRNYGRESAPIFESLGGRIVWRAEQLAMLIGPNDERWDLCFIAEYPNLDAFVSMIKNPDYRKAMEHRQIAVKTSRLIRTGALQSGANFAD